MRDLVAENRPLVLGGVYDGLSTRLAEQAGFEALFIGGFSVAATLLGEPDFGYLTQTDMAETARRVCRLTTRSVLVDVDTVYGNALNVLRTVELYHGAGAAGLFLEDQVFPKRCGHMGGKQVVERDEWLSKLRAVRSRTDNNDLFLVAHRCARAPGARRGHPTRPGGARSRRRRRLHRGAAVESGNGAHRERDSRCQGREHGRGRADAAARAR